jgi:hypothetical protein
MEFFNRWHCKYTGVKLADKKTALVVIFPFPADNSNRSPAAAEHFAKNTAPIIVTDILTFSRMLEYP